jgi:hypothetical protein
MKHLTEKHSTQKHIETFKNKPTKTKSPQKSLFSTKTNRLSRPIRTTLFLVMVKTVPVRPGSAALVFMVASAWCMGALIFVSG